MAVMRSPFVPTLCQQIALTALQHGDEEFQPIRAAFESRRRYAFERLQALGLKPAWPAGAYFFWFAIHDLGWNGREFAEQLLRAKNVLVTPGDLFGPSGKGSIRLSYAVEDGRLREGLGRMAEFLRSRPGVSRGINDQSPMIQCPKNDQFPMTDAQTVPNA